MTWSLTLSASTCQNKEGYSPVGSKQGKPPSPTRLNQGGSGRNETFSSLFLHHPSLFRDSHCSAEIPVLQSGGVELAASCFPEHRLLLLAGMDIPRGARAARRTPASGRAQLQRGRSPARTAALATGQRRAASSPSPPFLQKCLSLSLWLGLSGICENGCLQPPTNPNGV